LTNLATNTYPEGFCSTSAFLTCAGIVASNAGVIYLAYVTWSVIVKQQKRTNGRVLILIQVVGWLLGVALSCYFLGAGYLGIYKDLYCCTKPPHTWPIVLPVFVVFLVSSTSMAFFYYRTFTHIRDVQQKAEQMKSGGTGRATRATSVPASGVTTVAVRPQGGPGTAQPAADQQTQQLYGREPSHSSAGAGGARVAAVPMRGAVAPSSTPPTTVPVASSGEARRAAMSEKKSKDLARSMFLRGLSLVGVYYLCWFFVSFNSLLELCGYTYESLWPEVVSAWCIKLSPIIDVLLLKGLMDRAEANRTAAAGASKLVAGTVGNMTKVEASGTVSSTDEHVAGSKLGGTPYGAGGTRRADEDKFHIASPAAAAGMQRPILHAQTSASQRGMIPLGGRAATGVNGAAGSVAHTRQKSHPSTSAQLSHVLAAHSKRDPSVPLLQPATGVPRHPSSVPGTIGAVAEGDSSAAAAPHHLHSPSHSQGQAVRVHLGLASPSANAKSNASVALSTYSDGAVSSSGSVSAAFARPPVCPVQVADVSVASASLDSSVLCLADPRGAAFAMPSPVAEEIGSPVSGVV